MPRVLALTLALLLAQPFFRPSPAAERTAIVVGVSKTPSALPVLRMLESGAMGDDAELRLTVWVGPEQLIAMAQDKDYHLFTLPVTVAAVLHSRGAPVRMTNVNTWDGIRLVSSDPGLKVWGGLKGKKVHVPQRSSPPDALTKLFLGRAGLEPGRDVEFVYAPVAEISQLLRAGRIDSAVLIEPRAAAAMMGNDALRSVFVYGEEWKKAMGESAMLPSLGFGGRADFIDAHPELMRRFEEAYAEAVDWVLAHPAEAGALAEKHLGIDAAVIRRAMPELGLAYKTAAEAKADLELLYRALLVHSPAMLGGKLPDETLYWR